MTRVQIFASVVMVGMLAWIVYSVVQGKYLEAVAISCIGPVLVWFSLGAGRVSKGQDDAD
jgi:hypothetical protein